MTLNPKQLSEYYKTANFELLPSPNFRFFKFKLGNGEWKFISYIQNAEQLRKYALRYLPTDIYQSVSLWLCPSKRIENPRYKADKLFLNQVYVYFDLDGKTKLVKSNAKKIISKLGKPYEIHKTGFKGVRLIYKKKDNTNIVLPSLRMEAIKKDREAVVKSLGRLKTLDKAITTNLMGVIRVVGSINSKSGEVCTKLTLNQLYNLPESRNAMTSQTDLNVGLRRSKNSGKRRAGISLLPTYHYTAIDNVVRGYKDRYVALLKFNELSKRKLKYIQYIYNQGDFYVFKDEHHYYAISPTAISKCRLEKIMQFCNSINNKTFQKYYSVFYRCSAIYHKFGVFELAPKFICKIESRHGKNQFKSLQHLKYLSQFDAVETNNAIGKENLKYFEINVKNKFWNLR